MPMLKSLESCKSQNLGVKAFIKTQIGKNALKKEFVDLMIKSLNYGTFLKNLVCCLNYTLPRNSGDWFPAKYRLSKKVFPPFESLVA